MGACGQACGASEAGPHTRVCTGSGSSDRSACGDMCGEAGHPQPSSPASLRAAGRWAAGSSRDVDLPKRAKAESAAHTRRRAGRFAPRQRVKAERAKRMEGPCGHVRGGTRTSPGGQPMEARRGRRVSLWTVGSRKRVKGSARGCGGSTCRVECAARKPCGTSDIPTCVRPAREPRDGRDGKRVRAGARSRGRPGKRMRDGARSQGRPTRKRMKAGTRSWGVVDMRSGVEAAARSPTEDQRAGAGGGRAHLLASPQGWGGRKRAAVRPTLRACCASSGKPDVDDVAQRAPSPL